jgi:hypothetical protein
LGAASFCASIDLDKHPLLRRSGLFANPFRIGDCVENQTHGRVVGRDSAIFTASSEDHSSKETSPDHNGRFQAINQTCRPSPGPTEKR